MVKTTLLPTWGTRSASNNNPVADTLIVVAWIDPSVVSKHTASAMGNRTEVRTGFSPPALFHWVIGKTSFQALTDCSPHPERFTVQRFF